MAIPFAQFSPDYRPQGALAGILQAQQNSRQMQQSNLMDALKQQQLSGLGPQQKAQLEQTKATTALREAQRQKELQPSAEDWMKNPLEEILILTTGC